MSKLLPGWANLLADRLCAAYIWKAARTSRPCRAEADVIEEILDILLDRRLISIVTLLVACFILRDVVRTLVFIFDAGRWRRPPKSRGK